MAYFGNSGGDKVWNKVEPRTMFLVVWLGLCAVVVAIILKGGFGSEESAPIQAATAPKQPSMGLVLVPREEIPAGNKLTRNLFTLENRAIDGIELRTVNTFEQIEGSFAAAQIAANEPLLRDHVTFAAPANAVTAKIPEGFRAVTISVDAESGVEGWVRPGARVDVVWASQVRGRSTVTTIVENAEVLSAERSTEINPESGKPIPSHITLLVNIEDAQRIQLAKTSGSLSLNLRGTSDQAEIGGKTLAVSNLLKSGDNKKRSDATGWVQIGDKGFEIGTTGRLKPSEDAHEVLSKSEMHQVINQENSWKNGNIRARMGQ
ncbi:MAG: Flp pilus assembly protein CpaB [Proteobacteria bacterium]|nr:MAG: Flp pilus assembly protein CpaB [Pseudomonadota bacterium]